MHSRRSESSQTLTKTLATRPRFERLKHEALFCILLCKIARQPAACVNIVLCARVPRVWRILQADDWYDTQNICNSEHSDSHSSSCYMWSPNQASWGMLPVVIINIVGSCLYNICSAVLISPAFFHRKWRLLTLRPWPHNLLISSCAPCIWLHQVRSHPQVYLIAN